MEENKPQGEEQSKEERKVNERFDRALSQLTALMGPDWAKVPKIQKSDLPEVIAEIVLEKKLELFKKFKADFTSCVEEKRGLDKTIAEKTREFNKVIMEAKKEFLKKVDAALKLIAQMDLIEKEYYDTLRVAALEGEQTPTEETPNQ